MATLELVVSEFIVLALVCFFLIRHFKGNMVTLDVAVAVYLSWVLGFAGILLLPFDISVAVVDSRQSDTLIKVWNFIYWRYPSWCIGDVTIEPFFYHIAIIFWTWLKERNLLYSKKPFCKRRSSNTYRSTFILAWVILPMQMEYHNSGHFTFADKVMKVAMIIFSLNCFDFILFVEELSLIFTHRIMMSDLEGSLCDHSVIRITRWTKSWRWIFIIVAILLWTS